MACPGGYLKLRGGSVPVRVSSVLIDSLLSIGKRTVRVRDAERRILSPSGHASAANGEIGEGRPERTSAGTCEQQAITVRDPKSRVMPTVEYLNYEVLDDHGWEMDDDDLFENAADADLGDEDYGTLEVNEGEYILEAAEAQGYDWPFSCRAGACANCAAIVTEGEIEMDMQQILSDEEVEEKMVRLTCIGHAITDEVQIVYNAKHLDYLQNRVI